MNIQPIKRCANYHESVEWDLNHSADRARYDDFVAEMLQQGLTTIEIDNMWRNNFGVIPLQEPDRLYYCNIIDSSIKIVVTVLKRSHFQAGAQKKFEVIRLNHLFLDTYDYKRKFNVVDGKLVFEVEHKDLTVNLGGDPLNYEDSNWFTSMSIDDLLSRLKISIKGYTMPVPGDEPGRPTLYMNNIDFMESTDIEIVDKVFERNLYDYIEKRFEMIESDLK